MHRTVKIPCLLLAMFIGGQVTSGQSLLDIKRLIQDKEQNYDKGLRPVMNQSKPIIVYLTLDLISILEVNEVQQTITIGVLMGIGWKDELIRWNPKDYGGVNQFALSSDRFWTPTLMLSNTVETLESIGNPAVVVRYVLTGRAIYIPGAILKIHCSMDIRFYPWDSHACSIYLNAWGYTPNEYDLKNVTRKVGTHKLVPNGAWDVIGSTVRIEANGLNNYYTVGIYIQRKPTYVVINVILPVICLALLNLVVYFIPSECGERLSFSITLLLALAVFLTIVGDTLPKTSTPMAYFSFFLLTVLIVSNCITLSVAYSLCLYHRDRSVPVGSCWKRIVKVMRCRCVSQQTQQMYQHEQHINIRQVNEFDEPDEARDIKRDESDGGDVITWQHVSVAFDKVCFVMMLLVVITATCVTFGMIYTGLQQTDDQYVRH